jgi:hypothetical protein
VRGRVLGLLLLAAVVGVGGGLGVGFLRQPQPASGGPATPITAVSPSIPVDPPPPTPTYAPDDLTIPVLPTVLPFRTLRFGNSQQMWEVPVPKGWVGYDVDTDEPVPRQDWPTYDELRFRPKGEPVDGGYSLRIKAINSRLTPAQMVAAKIVGLRDVDVVDKLAQRDDLYQFTFRDGTDHLRYNYFRWFRTGASPYATLEMSVSGRAVDVPGLDALFQAFANALQPG